MCKGTLGGSGSLNNAFNSHLIYRNFQSTDTIIFFFCSTIEDSNMAEDLDIEAMLEAPYKKKVIIYCFILADL